MNEKRPSSIFMHSTLSIKIAGILVSLFLTTSCVTPGQTVKASSSDRVMAEYSQMKRRLPLIERENDVLKQENLQYKANVKQLTAKNEKLKSDLDTMNDIYERDMAFSEELIQNIQEKYETLVTESTKEIESANQRLDELELKRQQELKVLYDQIALQESEYKRDMIKNKEHLQKLEKEYQTLTSESTRKIESVTKRYDELELKRNQEIKALNDQIAMQQTTFNKERDELKQQHATKEYDLSSKINGLKKMLDSRTAQVDSLQTANNQISAKLANVLKQLQQVRLERDQIKKNLELKNAANGELSEKNSRARSGSSSEDQVN